jgi:uncharacterized protein with FMN-binding domain
MQCQKVERILGIVALALLAAAWFLGMSNSQARAAPFLEQVFPGKIRFKTESPYIYSAWRDQSPSQLEGYVALGSAHGYGGKLMVAAAVDLSGELINVVVVEHRETASFFRQVKNKDLIESLSGKMVDDSFKLGESVDAVTGATMTSRALTESVSRAVRRIADKMPGFEPAPESPLKLQFGAPEIVLLLLFAVGFIARASWFPWTKTARWISMLAGLVFLGYLFNKPLTLAYINKALLGFLPAWQLQPFFYLLLGGIFLSLIFIGWNPYCRWFCPFGAAQEYLAMIGGMKKKMLGKIHRFLLWLPRLLAFSAIVLALYHRNPSVSSYEVFGAMFQLIGTDFIFILLGITLAASLFLHRPWCRYLCPLRPVTEYVQMWRQWMREKIKTPS